MNLKNDISIPTVIRTVWEEEDKDIQTVDFSPSTIGLGAREYWMRRRGTGKHKVKASIAWNSFIGKVIHAGMQSMYNERDDVGVKYYTEIKRKCIVTSAGIDYTFGGSADMLKVTNSGRTTLYDWKSVRTQPNHNAMVNYIYKANLYKYIFKHAIESIHISNARYVTIMRDWDVTSKELPSKEIKIELVNDKRINEWVQSRVDEIMRYRNTPVKMIPFCSSKERWLNPNTGESVRCKRFCPVRDKCGFYRLANVSKATKQELNYDKLVL